MKIREYDNYKSYLNHQSNKLRPQMKLIIKKDQLIEKSVYDRYDSLNIDMKGKSILCLAARLGGEVRAFKKLGALSIGIDIEPGDKNTNVLHGDFHNINFPDSVFDYVFSNSIDHALYLDKYFTEAKRILKSEGVFLLEATIQKGGSHEVYDTQDISFIREAAKNHFLIENEYEIVEDKKFVLFILKNKL